MSTTSGRAIHCWMTATISPMSMAEASSQTATAKPCRWLETSGRLTAALAMMPVPMTDANQLGPIWVGRPSSLGDDKTPANRVQLPLPAL